jgi:phage baseplate assembly protein W
MARYIGFTTINKTKKFRLTDFELVKQDIINNFNIRKGDKLMNPNFGTIIWDMIFEPLDPSSTDAIVEDVKRIISNDPRVVAENVVVTTFEKGIQIELNLIYVNTDQRQLLTLNFNNQSQTVSLL